MDGGWQRELVGLQKTDTHLNKKAGIETKSGAGQGQLLSLKIALFKTHLRAH